MHVFGRFVFFLAALLVTAVPSAVRADTVRWVDPETGISISYPDQWKRLVNIEPEDVLTIAGPSRTAAPLCKLKARDDNRFLIYPSRYDDSVQKTAFGVDFWEAYIESEFLRGTLYRARDGAGFGRGYGSFAVAGYTDDRPADSARSDRAALMGVSLYYDRVFIIECSAVHEDYNSWASVFKNIVASVDFEKRLHEIPTGHYRDFLDDSFIYMYADPARRRAVTGY